MTIAFVCPDSFKDYEFAKRELSTIENIQNIICATSNSTRLIQAYVSECDGIKCRHEKRGGKEARIHRMIEDADKVVLIEYIDYDSKKKAYSRTQHALKYAKKLDKTLQHIEYNRTKKNATYLFLQPSRSFHHSESRWSSIAQMAFVWMGTDDRSLDIYRSEYESNQTKKWLVKKENALSFTGWNASNTIVEGKLRASLFCLDEENWSKDFDNISPDIVHIDDEKIVIIEVKTIKTYLKGNIELYRRVVDHLKQHSRKKCELYYLVSYGHEYLSDWKILNEDNADIILWEDFFSKIQKSDIASYIHSDLKQYTLMPEWL